MLRSSLASTLTFDSRRCSHFFALESFTPNPLSPITKLSFGYAPSDAKGACITYTEWKTHSTAKSMNIVMLSEEDRKTWEACREALSGLGFNAEEEDKILGKAFGFVHSPYWGEEREGVLPKYEVINGVLDYLRGLGLSEDDISKVIKKFPEVVGCSLENELKINVQILEKQWGIKGKSLRNLLLRNPKVLGYNVDCKGDCMALCTRCWVRF